MEYRAARIKKFEDAMNLNYWDEWQRLLHHAESTQKYSDYCVSDEFYLKNTRRINIDREGSNSWAEITKPDPVIPSELKYMYTFTVDPKKNPNLNVDWVQDDIQDYIVKIVKKIPNVTRAYYVKEHPDSNVHWHVILHSTGFIKQDHIKYYTKKYGRVDVSKSSLKSDEFSVKYLSKEGLVTTIKGEKPTVKS